MIPKVVKGKNQLLKVYNAPFFVQSPVIPFTSMSTCGVYKIQKEANPRSSFFLEIPNYGFYYPKR